MIVGSGLLARAFYPIYANENQVCIYAAGVSSSSCVEHKEFERERTRLTEALKRSPARSIFVYFGTCSVVDAEMANSPYVRHKLAMEHLVRESSNYLIIRLPQVAGDTPNPHTLLNFLYARISRGELFSLWKNATRNVIDVDDVLSIAKRVIDQKRIQNTVVNIANPINYKITEIVDTMEIVVGKKAIFKVVDRGTDYLIETINSMTEDLYFNDKYLKKLIIKYYATPKIINAIHGKPSNK
jgi:nucleoside-diphosphate-sugar epimerase